MSVGISYQSGWENGIKLRFEELLNFLDRNDTSCGSPFGINEWTRDYAILYQMVSHDLAIGNDIPGRIYRNASDMVGEYLKNKALPSLQGLDGDVLFKELNRRWRDQKILNRWITKAFYHLQQSYIKVNGLQTMNQKNLILFKDIIFLGVESSVAETFNKKVNSHREGEVVRFDLLKNCTDLFIEMGLGSLELYNELLEKPFLLGSKAFYKEKSKTWLVKKSTPEYVRCAMSAYDEERHRISAYLYKSTESKLFNVLDEELVNSTIIDDELSGCTAMLEKDKFDELHEIIRLFARVQDGLRPISDKFLCFLRSKIRAVVERRKARMEKEPKKLKDKDPDFVQELIYLENKYMKEFREVSLLGSVVSKALEECLSDHIHGVDSGVVIAHYLNWIVSTSGNSSSLWSKHLRSEAESDAEIDNIIDLLVHLPDKHPFEHVSHKLLSKRLLENKCPNVGREKSIIGKLKIKFGITLTSKMEVMLVDLITAKEINDEYQRLHGKLSSLSSKVDLIFSTQLLTVGMWPKHPNIEMKWPQHLQDKMDSFVEFYRRQHSGKRIKFVPSHGSCILEGTYYWHRNCDEIKETIYTIEATTLQAIVLELFSERSSFITFQEIRVEMFSSSVKKGKNACVTTDVLRSILGSLTFGKHKLLIKEEGITPDASFSSKKPLSPILVSSNRRSIHESDRFRANAHFKCPRTRFKLNVPSFSSIKDSDLKVLSKDKRLRIESCIVRVMKARKSLDLNGLIEEVERQERLLLFKPSVRDVKEAVENLIHKEYLERGEGSERNSFTYLA